MTGTEKTNKLVLTALMVCLVLLATYIIKIPSPFTQGYVHLGDTMIFLSVLLLGKKGGAAAAGLGSALADLLGGYAAYAPWTFLIKALMAFIMGAFIEAATKKKKHHVKIGSVPVVEIVGMILAGIEMVIGSSFQHRTVYRRLGACDYTRHGALQDSRQEALCLQA